VRHYICRGRDGGGGGCLLTRLLLQEWVSAIHGAIPSLAGMDGYLLKAAKKSGHGKERRRWFALRGQEML
jgi:hypothetical protein